MSSLRGSSLHSSALQSSTLRLSSLREPSRLPSRRQESSLRASPRRTASLRPSSLQRSSLRASYRRASSRTSSRRWSSPRGSIPRGSSRRASPLLMSSLRESLRRPLSRLGWSLRRSSRCRSSRREFSRTSSSRRLRSLRTSSLAEGRRLSDGRGAGERRSVCCEFSCALESSSGDLPGLTRGIDGKSSANGSPLVLSFISSRACQSAPPKRAHSGAARRRRSSEGLRRACCRLCARKSGTRLSGTIIHVWAAGNVPATSTSLENKYFAAYEGGAERDDPLSLGRAALGCSTSAGLYSSQIGSYSVVQATSGLLVCRGCPTPVSTPIGAADSWQVRAPPATASACRIPKAYFSSVKAFAARDRRARTRSRYISRRRSGVARGDNLRYAAAFILRAE